MRRCHQICGGGRAQVFLPSLMGPMDPRGVDRSAPSPPNTVLTCETSCSDGLLGMEIVLMCTPFIVEGSTGDPLKIQVACCLPPEPHRPPALACSPYLPTASHLSPRLSLVSPHRAVSRPGEPTPVPTPAVLAGR